MSLRNQVEEVCPHRPDNPASKRFIAVAKTEFNDFVSIGKPLRRATKAVDFVGSRYWTWSAAGDGSGSCVPADHCSAPGLGGACKALLAVHRRPSAVVNQRRH
jgi:hypothetical protein